MPQALRIYCSSSQYPAQLGRSWAAAHSSLSSYSPPPACSLFCGYIETYPLLATGLLLYLWCGLLVLRGSLSPAWSAGLLGVLLACHFMFVTLVPSLVYLVWRRRQNSGSLLALALTPTLFAAILQLLEVSPPQLRHGAT